MTNDHVWAGKIVHPGDSAETCNPCYLVAVMLAAEPGDDGVNWRLAGGPGNAFGFYEDVASAVRAAQDDLLKGDSDAAVVIACDRRPSDDPREAVRLGMPATTVVFLAAIPDVIELTAKTIAVRGASRLLSRVNSLFMVMVKLDALRGGWVNGST